MRRHSKGTSELLEWIRAGDLSYRAESQGMGSDIENRADDLKGDLTKTLGYCVHFAVGVLLIRTSTCPARAGPRTL